ncbi:MAG: hypothetical protein QM753_02940 [Thermomicrobiales bacterium]
MGSHRIRISRRVLLSLMAIVAMIGGPALTAAQGATPAATPAASPVPASTALTIPGGVPLDLAAMTLFAQEMDPAFVNVGGFLLDVGGIVAQQSLMPSDALRAQLEDSGLIVQYSQYGGQFTSDNAYIAAGWSHVELFADAEGAAKGLSILFDGSLDPHATPVPDPPVIGDDARLTRTTVDDPARGESYAIVDYSFRIGNLTAGVSLFTYDGTEPDADMAIALAKEMQTRVERVLAAEQSGPFFTTLRVEGRAGYASGTANEGYALLDGVAPVEWNDTPESWKARQESLVTSKVESVYATTVNLLPDGETDYNRSLTVSAAVYTFVTPEDAATFAKGAADGYIALFGQGDESMTARSDAPAGGSALDIRYDLGDGTMTEGTQVWVPVGNTVIGIAADRIGGVPEAGIDALIAAQTTCLATPTEQCAPIALPAEFGS